MARIFLCHASDDKVHIREVYHHLQTIEGFELWLDEEDLLPGQEWAREILRVLQTSDFILIFLSRTSVAKRGYVQPEMKMALDTRQTSPPLSYSSTTFQHNSLVALRLTFENDASQPAVRSYFLDE